MLHIREKVQARVTVIEIQGVEAGAKIAKVNNNIITRVKIEKEKIIINKVFISATNVIKILLDKNIDIIYYLLNLSFNINYFSIMY